MKKIGNPPEIIRQFSYLPILACKYESYILEAIMNPFTKKETI